MRKLGLLTGMIVGVMGLLSSSGLHAQVSAKDERAISDVEHKIREFCVTHPVSYHAG